MVLELEVVFDRLLDVVGNGGIDRLPAVLAEAVGARSGVVQLTDTNLRPIHVASSYFKPEMNDTYVRNEIFRHDPWAKLIANPFDREHAINFGERVSEAEYRRSLFYDQFIRLEGDDTGECLGLGTNLSGGLVLTVGLHRAFGKPFEDAEQQTLARLLPLLRRVVDLEHRLNGLSLKGRLYEAALHTMSQPCVIIANDGKVALINHAAEDVCRRRDGLVLRERTFSAMQPSEHRQFAALTKQVLQREAQRGGAMQVSRPAQLSPYRLLINPFVIDGITHALVLIDDPDRMLVNRSEMLKQLYGMTRGETEVAIAVAAGKSIEQIAAQRQVAVTTVKTLLQRGFRKTETERMSQLAALIGRLPA